MDKEQIAKEALKAMYGSEIEHPLQIQKEWSLKLANYIIAREEKAKREAYADALYQYRHNKLINYINYLIKQSEA